MSLPTKSLSVLVANFDDLPDTAMVDVKTVASLLNRGKSTIWRDVQAGAFPAPVKLGPACTRWNVGAIRRHLEALGVSA